MEGKYRLIIEVSKSWIYIYENQILILILITFELLSINKFKKLKFDNLFDQKVVKEMKNIMNLHFITLFVQIVICSLIFVTKHENIASAKVASINIPSALTFVDIFTAITVIMLGIQILFTVLGLPFLKNILPLQVLLQILAVFSFVCFILFRAHYAVVSYIWGFFCLLPFGLDIASRISGAVSFRKYKALDLY